MLEQLAQIVGLALGVLTLLATLAAFVLWLPSKLGEEREARMKEIATLSSRVSVLELRSIDDKQLEAALDKAFARALRPIESRLEGVEKGFAAASAEMHKVIVQLAILEEREGGVDYSKHNARTLEKAIRG